VQIPAVLAGAVSYQREGAEKLPDIVADLPLFNEKLHLRRSEPGEKAKPAQRHAPLSRQSVVKSADKRVDIRRFRQGAASFIAFQRQGHGSQPAGSGAHYFAQLVLVQLYPGVFRHLRKLVPAERQIRRGDRRRVESRLLSGEHHNVHVFVVGLYKIRAAGAEFLRHGLNSVHHEPDGELAFNILDYRAHFAGIARREIVHGLQSSGRCFIYLFHIGAEFFTQLRRRKPVAGEPVYF